jgi:murein L,D-transpeptidase YafK
MKRYWVILVMFVTLGMSDAESANSMKIVVHKSTRLLELFRGEERLFCFRCALGFQPLGNKEKEGDGKTPEGRFYVCVKNPNSSYYRSLGISYPNQHDAERGLRAGLIDRTAFANIQQAITAGKTPPWNTALGGQVFIHGRGAKRDWTFGCVALEDEDMLKLFEVVEIGAQVEIFP